jgi:hypothetical protein
MNDEERLVLVFVPALAALLVRAEDLKGSPLTEAEVVRIRDAASCVAMPPDVACQTEEARGYPDIDPEDCWAAWLRLRAEMRRA